MKYLITTLLLLALCATAFSKEQSAGGAKQTTSTSASASASPSPPPVAQASYNHPGAAPPCHCHGPRNTPRGHDWNPFAGCCDDPNNRMVYPEMKGTRLDKLPIIPEVRPRQSDLPPTVDPGRTYENIMLRNMELAQQEIDNEYKLRSQHAERLTLIHGTDEVHNEARVNEEAIRAKYRQMAAEEIEEARRMLDESVDHDNNQIRQQNEAFSRQQEEFDKERAAEYEAFEAHRHGERMRQLERRAVNDAYRMFGYEAPRRGHQNGVARLRDAILKPGNEEKFQSQQARLEAERQEGYSQFEEDRNPDHVHAEVTPERITPEEAAGEQEQLSMDSPENNEEAVVADNVAPSNI